jgi:hypothetical protein
MSWYCIDLTAEQVAFGFVDIIRAETAEAWLSRGGPADATLWFDQQSEKTMIYFSPVLAQTALTIITRFNGRTCDEPDKQGLEFLLGLALLDDPP